MLPIEPIRYISLGVPEVLMSFKRSKVKSSFEVAWIAVSEVAIAREAATIALVVKNPILFKLNIGTQSRIENTNQ